MKSQQALASPIKITTMAILFVVILLVLLLAFATTMLKEDTAREPALCLDMNGTPMPNTMRYFDDGRTLGYSFDLNGSTVIITPPDSKLRGDGNSTDRMAQAHAFHLYRCIDVDPVDLMRQAPEGTPETAPEADGDIDTQSAPNIPMRMPVPLTDPMPVPFERAPDPEG